MPLFKLLAYLAAFMMFLTLLLHSAALTTKGNYHRGFALVLFVYYYGLLGSSFYNHEELNLPVLLKLLLAPAFLAFGVKVESAVSGSRIDGNSVKFILILFLAMPLAVLVWQLATGANVYERGIDFSIFANRNNAALYAVVLLSLYAVYMGGPFKRPWLYLLAGASFATLGVLFAVIVSLLLLVTSKRNVIRSIASILIVGGIAVTLAIYEVGVFARFKPVIGTLDLLLFSSTSFRALSYGQLVATLNTTDLSLAFRIKHWLNIYDIYAQGEYLNWFFGYGIGASEIKTTDHIVPHNDYLRYLFEAGVVTFIGFVGIMLTIVLRLGRRWETVPLLTIILYMISENLVDNYVAMVIFYYTAGVLTCRVTRENNRNVGEGNA